MSETAWQKDAIEAFRTWIYGRSVGPGDRITFTFEVPSEYPPDPGRDVLVTNPDNDMPEVWECKKDCLGSMYEFGTCRRTWQSLVDWSRESGFEIHVIRWTTIRHPEPDYKILI